MSEEDDVEDPLVPLRFTVVASSQESGYEASTLQEYNEEGNGWLSKGNDESGEDQSETLVLNIQHEDNDSIVHALEILCHGMCESELSSPSVCYVTHTCNLNQYNGIFYRPY